MSDLINEMETTRSAEKTYRVDKEAFSPEGLVTIKGDSIYDTSRQIGKTNKNLIKNILAETAEKIDNKEYEQWEKYAKERIVYLEQLLNDESDTFTTSDGINHLERYLQSIKGFTQGAEVTLEEAYILQSNEVGCQTVGVRNKTSGEIVLVHMEEDPDQLSVSGDASHDKKWLIIEEGGRKYEFCNYPFFWTYGPGYGVIKVNKESNPLFVASDYISPDVPEVANKLDPTLITFLLMDSGSIDKAEELVNKIKQLPDIGFAGGFISHLVEGGVHPRMKTFEFGHKFIGVVIPTESETREVITGVNYPNSKELQEVDKLATSGGAELELEKKEARRLKWYGLRVGEEHDNYKWGKKEAIQLTNIVQSPGKEMPHGWRTGLSNPKVAQHCVVYVAPGEELYIIAEKGYLKN